MAPKEMCIRDSCVILASGGYPVAYEKGKPISGLVDGQLPDQENVTVYHSGTAITEMCIRDSRSGGYQDRRAAQHQGSLRPPGHPDVRVRVYLLRPRCV